MKDLLVQIETLQNMLIAQATGGAEDNSEYTRLRQVLLSQASLEPLIPQFVRTCRSLFQFWQFIKYEYGTYAERREFLWEQFRPLLEGVERGGLTPADQQVTTALDVLDQEYVQTSWSKALDRRQSDPEGAITAARTLLETIFKFILTDLNVPYDDKADLPELYKLTSEALNLAPSQHTEGIFKQILGGCASVVLGLGSIRSRLGDSHGKGPTAVRPAPRHAELAVNLAGAMSAFAVATWQARKQISP